MICKNIFIYLLLIISLFTELTADKIIPQENTNRSNSSNLKIVNLSSDERDFLITHEIKCVVSPDWIPFNFKEKGKLVGISLDYWNLIKKKTLIESKCKEVDSFDTAINLIRNKKADITLSTAVSEDKVNYGLFSLPYASYPIAIATTSDKRYIGDMTLLNNRKVAVGRSYNSYELLKGKYPNIDFIQYGNNLQALKALSKGDVFAVIDILPALSQVIADYGFKNIKISGTTEFSFDIRVMVRSDYEKLVSIINKGIIAITKDEMQSIKNNWFSVKVEELVDLEYLWELLAIILFILFILFYKQWILDKHNKKLKLANDKIEQKSYELEKKTQELARQNILFEKIYNESTDGIILLNQDNQSIIDCNRSAFKMLKYETKMQFIIENIFNFFPEYQPSGFNSKKRFLQMIEETIKDSSKLFEWLHKTKEGKNIWIEVVMTNIEINNEKILHIVWRNIDRRKKIEYELNELTNTLEHRVQNEIKKNEQKSKQLIQQSRLAQMGEMISMIAHQWRQPLTAISATANNVLIRLMIDEKVEKKVIEEELSLISNYSQHLSSTIDDFRNFFKSDRKKIKTTIESIIDNSLSIVSNSLISKDISLIKNFNCNKELELNATEVNQVILNLIKNAEDALTENGVSPAKIIINTYFDDDNVFVEINDNAGGIPSNIIEKVFDPYFSTKSEKDGTGLGLYMSKIIINDHCQGNLSVENNKYGANFKIKIPI